jgi:hypothetical protein
MEKNWRSANKKYKNDFLVGEGARDVSIRGRGPGGRRGPGDCNHSLVCANEKFYQGNAV